MPRKGGGQSGKVKALKQAKYEATLQRLTDAQKVMCNVI